MYVCAIVLTFVGGEGFASGGTPQQHRAVLFHRRGGDGGGVAGADKSGDVGLELGADVDGWLQHLFLLLRTRAPLVTLHTEAA